MVGEGRSLLLPLAVSHSQAIADSFESGACRRIGCRPIALGAQWAQARSMLRYRGL